MPERRVMTTNVLLGVVVTFLTAFALYVSRPVVVPILFGLFIAVLLRPLVRRLSRRLPYWLSLMVVVVALLTVAGSAGMLLYLTVNDMIEELPRYSKRFERVLSGALGYLEARGIKVDSKEFGLEKNLSGVLQFIGSSLTSIFDILGRILVVSVLGLFAIFEGRNIEDRIRAAFGPERGERILAVLGPMAEGVGRYLRTKTVISIFTGLAAYVICLIVRIDFAFMWGMLVFILNFVPYIGPVIAVIPAVAVAFLQYDALARGIVAILTLGTSQVVSGIVLEPQVMGHSFRISALFVLVSMLFWGWFWGLAGVVLAIPVSAAIVIGCANVERLRPIATLLGFAPNNDESAAPADAPGSGGNTA